MSVKDALEMAKKNKVEIVDLKFVDFPGLWQHFSIPAAELNAELFEEGLGFDGSSIRGFQSINESDMNVMIDSGSDQNFPVLERGLRHIGIKVRDVNLVINSHEHCDHIGANRYFQDCAMIAAYRLAASKIITGDYYVTMDALYRRPLI